MAMGDLTFVDKDGAFVYFFNKDLIADLVMENPYELVRNNKWTVDKAYEMAKSASIDLNSDGKINGEDRFGNFSEANVFYEAVLAADELFFKKDEKDLPYSDLLNERLLESIAKWGEFMIDRQTTMLSGDYLNAYPAIWDKQLEMLNNKQLLLVHTSISRASMLRSFDCNFGIIPMPKLNEYQENYANAVHPTCGTTLCIPISASDLERTGIIVEALTAKSYYTLKPAYYDITLKTKLSRDDESSEMLDIIFANRVYDLGRMYNWGDVSSVLIQLAHQKTLAYVSRIERKAAKIQTDMENTIALFENQ
ncbi:hypothetical protein FACS1894219_10840 [Clostridia bacterium]|nr:hypothetical protein FACS1894219_10840 [Clostridia bacterium]